MNATTAREIRQFAASLGWTRRQYRAAKRKYQDTPRPEREAALREMRDWNAGTHPARRAFEAEVARRREAAGVSPTP